MGRILCRRNPPLFGHAPPQNIQHSWLLTLWLRISDLNQYWGFWRNTERSSIGIGGFGHEGSSAPCSSSPISCFTEKGRHSYPLCVCHVYWADTQYFEQTILLFKNNFEMTLKGHHLGASHFFWSSSVCTRSYLPTCALWPYRYVFYPPFRSPPLDSSHRLSLHMQLSFVSPPAPDGDRILCYRWGEPAVPSTFFYHLSWFPSHTAPVPSAQKGLDADTEFLWIDSRRFFNLLLRLP